MKTNTYEPNDDFDLPEFTDEELAQFKPIHEVMPRDFMDMVLAHQAERAKLGKVRMPNRRGKQIAPTKEAITIRLSQEVLTAFRATGKGWQTRINEVLLKHVQTAR